MKDKDFWTLSTRESGTNEERYRRNTVKCVKIRHSAKNLKVGKVRGRGEFGSAE
jgi:hypothetical protein